MMRLLSLFLVISCSSCLAPAQSARSRNASTFEQIDFEGILKRYLGKDFKPGAPIEGIYEVSCTITKRGKGFLSRVERDKIVMRRENYAKVAIVKDWPDTEREYLEISLNAKSAPQYPIIGDFQSFAEGGGFVYKHYVPKGPSEPFTFTRDLQPEILEGIRSEVKGSKTIIYKLTYLKIYPKRNDIPITKGRGNK